MSLNGKGESKRRDGRSCVPRNETQKTRVARPYARHLRGRGTNAHSTSDKLKMAMRRGWRIQMPYLFDTLAVMLVSASFSCGPMSWRAHTTA